MQFGLMAGVPSDKLVDSGGGLHVPINPFATSRPVHRAAPRGHSGQGVTMSTTAFTRRRSVSSHRAARFCMPLSCPSRIPSAALSCPVRPPAHTGSFCFPFPPCTCLVPRCMSLRCDPASAHSGRVLALWHPRRRPHPPEQTSRRRARRKASACRAAVCQPQQHGGCG